MERSTNLKPCPFCGGEAHLDRHDIFCDCGVKIEIPLYVSGLTSVGGFPTYEEAVQMMVEAWNDRADDNLINRQKAEIERLKDMVAQNEGVLPRYERFIKAEAIKEFAERLKQTRVDLDGIEMVAVGNIDSISKEMTEE